MKNDFIDLEDFGGGKFGKRDFKLPEFKLNIWLVLTIAAVLWLASGLYQLRPGYHAVVQTFGSHTGTIKEPGLRYRLPSPIQKVTLVWVEEVKRVEIGFRTVNYSATTPKYSDHPNESEMLTADENIIDAELAVQYVIDPMASEKWVFNVKDPEQAMIDICGAAFRTEVGRHTLDNILTTEKEQIQDSTESLIQQVADSYDFGVDVQNVQLQEVKPPDRVVAAFKDVASAKEDKIRREAQAREMRNQIVPEAQGQAKQLVNEALGYKSKVVNEALGDALRFDQVYEQYRVAQDITRRRLYIEALEEIFPGMKKIIVENDDGVIKLLPLETLTGGESK